MMTEAPARPTTLFENTLASSRLAAPATEKEPAWLKSLRKSAYQRYMAHGLPTRRQEAWRFTDLSRLTDTAFTPFSEDARNAVDTARLQALLAPEAKGTRLVFINGVLSEQYSSLNAVESGLVVMDLPTALSRHENNVKTVLNEPSLSEGNPFVHLNTALFSQGACIIVPANTVVSSPVQLMFLTNSDAPGTTHPKTLILVENNAHISVVATYATLIDTPTPYFNNAVTHIRVAEGAQLEYTHIQAEDDDAFHLASTEAVLQAKSRLNMTTVAMGSHLSRHELQVRIEGSGADCQLNGLSILNGTFQAHHHVQVDHAAPGSTSGQLFKGILDGAAKSEFDGTICIRKNAAQTDASQLNRNLILSDDAKVFTRPQLRIDNDDVKCSHGATVGQLDEAQLFYLASRGLSPQTARAVLTYGFAEEVIDRISIPSIRSFLMSRMHVRLDSTVQHSPL